MRLILLAVGLLVGACSQADPVTAQSESLAAAPPVVDPGAHEAREGVADRTDPRAWYVGHAWVLEGERCDGGDSAIIDAGGRFESVNYGGGTWSLDGDRITFDSDTDEPRTWTLRQVEDGVAELRHEDGRVFREVRCPPVR